MTTPFEDDVALIVDRMTVEVRLCADGHTTLLDRLDVESCEELVEVVLGRFGLPDAVLRDEASPDLRPLGWVVPAPPSPATSGRVVDTPMGPVATPAAYVEVLPVVPGFGFRVDPALPGLMRSPAVAGLLAGAGLTDGAGGVIPELWDEYRAGCENTSDPAARFASLLSVHIRARSAGAMALAAHAVDNAGEVLHRTGAFGVAADLHRWALGVYDRSRLSEDRATALANLTHALWHDGRHEAAADAGLRAYKAASSLRDRSLTVRAALMVAYPLADLGREGEAVAILEQVAAPDDGLVLGWWHHAHAHVALASGELDVAWQHARAALTPGYGKDGRQDERESLLAATYDLAEAIARALGNEPGAGHAWANAQVARRRLPAPYIH